MIRCTIGVVLLSIGATLSGRPVSRLVVIATR